MDKATKQEVLKRIMQENYYLSNYYRLAVSKCRIFIGLFKIYVSDLYERITLQETSISKIFYQFGEWMKHIKQIIIKGIPKDHAFVAATEKFVQEFGKKEEYIRKQIMKVLQETKVLQSRLKDPQDYYYLINQQLEVYFSQHSTNFSHASRLLQHDGHSSPFEVQEHFKDPNKNLFLTEFKILSLMQLFDSGIRKSVMDLQIEHSVIIQNLNQLWQIATEYRDKVKQVILEYPAVSQNAIHDGFGFSDEIAMLASADKSNSSSMSSSSSSKSKKQICKKELAQFVANFCEGQFAAQSDSLVLIPAFFKGYSIKFYKKTHYVQYKTRVVYLNHSPQLPCILLADVTCLLI